MQSNIIDNGFLVTCDKHYLNTRKRRISQGEKERTFIHAILILIFYSILLIGISRVCSYQLAVGEVAGERRHTKESERIACATPETNDLTDLGCFNTDGREVKYGCCGPC